MPYNELASATIEIISIKKADSASACTEILNKGNEVGITNEKNDFVKSKYIAIPIPMIDPIIEALLLTLWERSTFFCKTRERAAPTAKIDNNNINRICIIYFSREFRIYKSEERILVGEGGSPGIW